MGMFDEPDIALDAAGAAEGGGTRPRRTHPQAAPADQRDGDRGLARPAPVQGARPTSRPGPQLRPAAVLHQPRRHTRTPVRDGAAGAGGRQGDGQASRRHDQRHGAGDDRGRTAPATAALRRQRRRTAHRRCPGEYRPVARAVGGQRIHLHHSVAARTHRRSTGAGEADCDGDRHRQGEPPVARADTAARMAVLSASVARTAVVPRAGAGASSRRAS